MKEYRNYVIGVAIIILMCIFLSASASEPPKKDCMEEEMVIMKNISSFIASMCGGEPHQLTVLSKVRRGNTVLIQEKIFYCSEVMPVSQGGI